MRGSSIHLSAILSAQNAPCCDQQAHLIADKGVISLPTRQTLSCQEPREQLCTHRTVTATTANVVFESAQERNIK